MHKLSFIALSLLVAFSLHAQKPWQSIQNISVEQAAKQFANNNGMKFMIITELDLETLNGK